MQRKIQAVLVCMLVLAGLTVSPLARPGAALAADSRVENCTEASFDAALAVVQASGGGQLSLACSATINFTAQKTITSDVTIVGNGAFTTGGVIAFTVLDGGGTTRLFEVNAGARLKLVNLALENGAALEGAAILSAGTLEIVNSRFSENHAVEGGGAIKMAGGSLEIVQGDFFSNSAGDDGAAIYVDGTARITTGSFFNNKATSGGGAIYNSGEFLSGSTLEIARSEFTNNSSSFYGGAIENEPFSTLTVRNSSFNQNFAFRKGGAINNGGTATVTASTFNANHVPTDGAYFHSGGAISNGSMMSITSSTFVANYGMVAGAIYNHGVGYVNVTASTFSDNQATFNGATLRSDTGFYRRDPVGMEVGASILAGKPGAGHCLGVIPMTGHTLIDDDTCGPLRTGAAVSDNIMLSNLGDHGGPTATLLPLEGSPAREGIPQAECLSYSSSTDQRGVARPQGNCEIGAVELGEITLEPLRIIDVFNQSPALPGQQVSIVVVPFGPAGYTFTYEFDCNNDGSYEISQQAVGATLCTFPEPGSYPVTVRVSLPPNMSASVQTIVDIQAGTPRITSLGLTPSPSSVGATVELEAGYSNLDTTASHTCTINWGDGGDDQAGTVEEQAGGGNCLGSHIYADAGQYTVTVEICDGDVCDTDTVEHTVHAVEPIVNTPQITPSPSNEGESVVASAGFSDPLGSPTGPETHTCTVDYGDGSGAQDGAVASGNCTGPTHTYDDNGSYTVTVSVADATGDIGSNTATHTVGNDVPTASFTAPAAVDEGSAIELSLTNPSDPSSADTQAGFSYAFDCGDGNGYGAFGPDASASYPASDEGARTVKGKIQDKDGGETEYSASITINNVAPTVTLGDDVEIAVGDSYTDTGSVSDPGDNDSLSATVDYGDSSGAQPLALNTDGAFTLSHTYFNQGQYTVEVCVTDGDGGQGCDELVVQVVNPAPTLIAGGPYSGVEGSPVSLDATVNGTLIRVASFYEVNDATDGTTCVFGDRYAIDTTLTCTDNGIFTVTLEIIDPADPLVAIRDTATVTISNVAPTVTLGNDIELNEGDVATAAGSFTDPGDNDTHTATVDYGDGSGVQTLSLNSEGGFTLSHAYLADDGQYTVEVCVTDDEQASDCDDLRVTVLNVAPTITNISLDVSGARATVTVTASDPAGVNDPLHYAFDCDNSGAYEVEPQPENSATCNFGASEGVFQINVQVDDGDGGITTDSASVTVASTMCSNNYSGVLRYADDCRGHETAITIPDPNGPVTLCASVHTGLLRAPARGACAGHETTYVLPEDGPLNVCVKRRAQTMRVVDDLSRCTRNEFGRVIAATKVGELPPRSR